MLRWVGSCDHYTQHYMQINGLKQLKSNAKKFAAWFTNRIQLANQHSVDVIHYYQHSTRRVSSFSNSFRVWNCVIFGFGRREHLSIRFIPSQLLRCQSKPLCLNCNSKRGELSRQSHQIQNQYINGKWWAKSQSKLAYNLRDLMSKYLIKTKIRNRMRLLYT